MQGTGTRRVWQGCLVAAAGVLLTACSVHAETSRTASADSVAKTASSALQKKVGRAPEKMDCPHSLKLKTGNTMRCTLTESGSSYPTDVEVSSVGEGGKYRLNVQVAQKPSGSG